MNGFGCMVKEYDNICGHLVFALPPLSGDRNLRIKNKKKANKEQKKKNNKKHGNV